MPKSIAVIAAHPDDEVLGCGGTIAKHSEQHDRVHILILAQGEQSRALQDDNIELSKKIFELRRSAKKASEILGAESIEFCDFPDNQMDSITRLSIIKKIETFLEQYKPSRIYTHSPFDVNVDHYVTYESVITATRPLPGYYVNEVYSFEVLSSTEWRPPNSHGSFKPNFYSRLSDRHIEKKLEALSAYEGELRTWPHPRSLVGSKALLQYRGTSIGSKAAEAFEVCRVIE